MELGKCHLFFSCGTMKSFLFLLFLLLLFDSLQGSAISHKRSIRALNTTLETNFDGTYERINPCTNAEIERTSYVASHEFRHHTEENNWNDYTNKCSSIISSFLQALGNLVRFNNKQDGVFNFHINTTISQKQDGQCVPDKRTSCDTLPTITIEATDCELPPVLPCENHSDEQLYQDQEEERTEKDSLNKGICRENQVLRGNAPGEPNFNENSDISTSYGLTEDDITPLPFLDVPAAEDEAKLLEDESVLNVDDIFLPTTIINTSLEPEFPTAGLLMGNKNSPPKICDASESATPTDYQTEESFNVPSSSHSYLGDKTVTEPIPDEEPFYPNQFSETFLRKQQPTAYSKQLFDDNLDKQVPDSELLPAQQPDNSFIFPNQIQKVPFASRESNPNGIQQPKNTASEENPPADAIEQNEESFQQSRKEFDNFEETHSERNTDISSETVSYPSQKYLTESEEVPFSQITSEGPPQVLTNNERQFMDYDGQTSASGFSTSYPIPHTQVPVMKSTSEVTLDDQDSNPLQKTSKEEAREIDYPGEFFTAQPVSGDNFDPFIQNDASPNRNQDFPSSDDLSTFGIGKSLTDPTTSTFNERFLTKNPFYNVNDNQFLTTPMPERPPFRVSNELPLLIPELQKSAGKTWKNSDIDEVTDAELSSPSDQYQSVARPKSQYLQNDPEQYGHGEGAKYVPETKFSGLLVQPDSEITTNKPFSRSFSVTPEYQTKGLISFDQASSSPQYPIDRNFNQKFSSPQGTTSDSESFSSSESETLSDTNLTTLPPKQDSFENFQKLLTTFDSYQDESDFSQTPFPSALEGKYIKTSPGEILNDDEMSSTSEAPTLNFEQSSNDIYTSSPAPESFDDYQDSLYPKPYQLQSSFTTPMPYFDEKDYESSAEPNFANNQKSYSDVLQSTIPTVSGNDQLKKKPFSYSDLALERPLSYASDIFIPIQNYDKPKSQQQQVFENNEDSLTDVKPFSNEQYKDLTTDSFDKKSSMSYDSEVQSDSFEPQMEQYPNGALIPDKSKQNSGNLPDFADNFPEEKQRISSPELFTPDNNKKVFPDRSSFGSTETISSPVFNTADGYLEPVTANSYYPEKFSENTDTRPETFSSELFTTPLPPVSFLPDDLSPPFNYKKNSDNTLNQSQVDEPLAFLGQSTDKNFPPKFEEPPSAFLAPPRAVNKIDSVFSMEKNLEESPNPAASEEEPTQSTIPVYDNQSDQPSYYPEGGESFIPYAEDPRVQTALLPERKSFPKPLMTDLPEYDNTNYSEEETSVDDYSESESYNYSVNDSDNFGTQSAVDLQKMETIDQKSNLDYSNRFSDFSPKKSSADFFPSLKRPLTENSPDSPQEQTEFYLNNRQPNSALLEPHSLISTTTDHDLSQSQEFQSSSVTESTPSSTIPLTLTKNQKLRSNKFKIPDTLASAPNNQPQKITSYTSYPNNYFSKDLQSPSEENFESVVSSESRFTKPEYYRNSNRAPNRQFGNKINALQSVQQESENYNQFPSASLWGPKNFNDKEVVPSNDYSLTLQSRSQMEPLVPDYNKQVFKPYPEPDSARIPQPYLLEPSSQTLSEEYSDIIPTAETEIPYDIDETTPPTVPYDIDEATPPTVPYDIDETTPPTIPYDIDEATPPTVPYDIDETTPPTIPEESSLHAKEQSESIQEKLLDYSFPFASEQQLKSQPSNDYTPDPTGKIITEKSIDSLPQTSNSENIPFFEEKPGKFIDSDSFPNQEPTGTYEQDAEGIDYNQPEYKESDYLDESPNINSDFPVPDLSGPPQSLIASPPLDSVLNDFTPIPQSPASTSHQLNSNLNVSSQKRSDIPLRYPQSKKEISFVTDNISPQPQPTTAVYNDEEKTEMLSTSKPQPQTSLNSADNSDDNIPKQSSNLPNRQYQITPDAAFSSELEPIPPMIPPIPSVSSQGNAMNFGTSDYDASSQPSFPFQSQPQQLDAMRVSPYETQNKFDPKLSSRVSNASPPYAGTAIQSLRKPSVINSEYFYNSQEQLSPRDRPRSRPDLNNRAIPVDYQQDRSIQPIERLSSNDSPRKSKHLNDALQYPGARRLTAPGYGPRGWNLREEFQTQPSSRYPNDVPLINGDKNRFSSAAPKHSTFQRFDPQLNPADFPNQNYNARAPLNVPVRNLHSNEPARQTNRASPQYFRSNARLTQNSFENPLLFNADQYSKGSETEPLSDQTIKNADSPLYDDYDQAQLSNEKLLEYDEDITPNLYAENSQIAHDMMEEKPQSSDDFLTEADPHLGFNRQADDFQDRSSPDNVPSYPSPPLEKGPHSNPLLHTLESHLTFPFEEHLRPSAVYASSEDSEKESPNQSFSFDPRHQGEFPDASYSGGRDSEPDIVNYQQSQPLNGVDTAQDIMKTQQPDSQVLVSDPNIPSNKPGEDFEQNPTPLLCPLDLILKGNMTAPSYYILISKLPVDNDEEEQFKVEKVFLGDGTPLNCSLSPGKIFPTSLYTSIPFSATGPVKLRTKSDSA